MRFFDKHPKIKNLGLIVMGMSIGFEMGFSTYPIYDNYDQIYNKYIQPTIYELKQKIMEKPGRFKERDNKIYLSN